MRYIDNDDDFIKQQLTSKYPLNTICYEDTNYISTVDIATSFYQLADKMKISGVDVIPITPEALVSIAKGLDRHKLTDQEVIDSSVYQSIARVIIKSFCLGFGAALILISVLAVAFYYL